MALQPGGTGDHHRVPCGPLTVQERPKATPARMGRARLQPPGLPPFQVPSLYPKNVLCEWWGRGDEESYFRALLTSGDLILWEDTS